MGIQNACEVFTNSVDYYNSKHHSLTSYTNNDIYNGSFKVQLTQDLIKYWDLAKNLYPELFIDDMFITHKIETKD